jgi:hypothetical protein
MRSSGTVILLLLGGGASLWGALGCGATAAEWERATRENERLKLLVEIRNAKPGTKMEGVTVKLPTADQCPSDEAPEGVVAIGPPGRTPPYSLSLVGGKGGKGAESRHAKDGEVVLGVEMLVEAIGTKNVSVGSSGEQLVDGDGHSYTSILYWDDPCGPALKSSLVQPGSRARGWMGFAIPKHAKDLVLHYRLPFTFGQNNLIRFQLDR